MNPAGGLAQPGTHFTLLALEEGDPESAQSIGVGLSPGDEAYAEPYLYCNPWPVPARLPAPPAPLQWHTEGFTSLLCPVSRLASPADLTTLARRGYATAAAALGGS